MLLIILNFIEIILCSVIIWFLPDNSNYEIEYLFEEYDFQYKHRYINDKDRKYYNISMCDYYVEKLKTPKVMNVVLINYHE